MKNSGIELTVAILGLGEAGSRFANDLAALGVSVRGWDPAPRRALHPSVYFARDNSDAVQGADFIFNVNLSAVAEAVARETAPALQSGQIFLEMNTAAPDLKTKVFDILRPSGVGFVDLAIMAPVPPAGIRTPMLACGPGAQAFCERMLPLGLQIEYLEGAVGAAAARKLLRSIVYKGIAGVVCEAMAAGQALDMETFIRAQIRSLIGGDDALIDRFVEGSRTHAERRAREMKAVQDMLENAGLDAVMTRAARENLLRLAAAASNAPTEKRPVAVPYMQIRGGTSKGLFFKAADLPTDPAERDRWILAAMEGVGPGDPRQIDGLGGANPLSSKAAVVSLSDDPAADLDYFFLQVLVGKGKISTVQTCGNILAGVAPFAIESGMIPAQDPLTAVRIRIVNTGGICEALVETPGGKVNYAGEARIDGVPGTAAPVVCNYADTVGATCGALFPTGAPLDTIAGFQATLIDNGMPLVALRAADLGISGYESKADLDANEDLKRTLEAIRLEAGFLMRLGDVRDQSVPKMCLLSPPRQGGLVNTRMFIPHVCHDAIGVLAAISVATACVWPGTIAEGIAAPADMSAALSVEHPGGEMSVRLEMRRDATGNMSVVKSGVLRTARLLSRGTAFLPL